MPTLVASHWITLVATYQSRALGAPLSFRMPFASR